MPTTVTAAIRPYLRNLLDQVDGPIVAVATDQWWADLLPDDVAMLGDSELTTGTTVVSVNRLRGLLPLDWLAGSGASLIYAEPASHHPRPLARPRFDAVDITGELWAAGLSSVDIHRPVIACADGRWELAIGRARPTPRQVIPS